MSGIKVINPAGGAFADSFQHYTDRMSRIQSSLVCTNALTGNQVVSLNVDSTGKVTKATTSVVAHRCIGIADNGGGNSAAGDVVQVVTFGPVKNVAAQGAITAGDQVGRSDTTAGSVAAVTSDASLIVGAVLGVALTTAASSLVDVFVRPC